MKLYTGPLSLFSAKVRIALEEKGLDHEHVSVGWSAAARYEPHHPDVARLNPRRQVPVLVDGDTVVHDSTVILEYLEDRYPAPALRPADPAGRARMRRLEDFADTEIFAGVWDLIEEVFYPAPAAGRDPARAEEARAAVARCAGALDAELAGREWLCEAFGIADIGCFVMLSAAATLGAAPDAAHANLLGWLGRCGARPAVRRDVEAMQAYVAALPGPAASGPAQGAAAAAPA